eukprot:Blabericola_migrator_1__3648@NODE_2092_length_3290_cov_10_497983_g1326_i0_p2_GENE_NODE_2092_length_3290_cov_10_497983_g1326_i0NODE_2092_length_3290_cov_10_497983_g1326_i0_p2_ORF_typecomplete_len146_score16_71_NODE_2092_length_3290_cov_10_497983_g1326_i016762113
MLTANKSNEPMLLDLEAVIPSEHRASLSTAWKAYISGMLKDMSSAQMKVIKCPRAGIEDLADGDWTEKVEGPPVHLIVGYHPRTVSGGPGCVGLYCGCAPQTSLAASSDPRRVRRLDTVGRLASSGPLPNDVRGCLSPCDKRQLG